MTHSTESRPLSAASPIGASWFPVQLEQVEQVEQLEQLGHRKILDALPGTRRRWHWILGSLGTYQIVAIIMRATGGLEKRQADKYGASSDFQAYAASTPVLLPGTRQYRWEKEEPAKGNND